jgi:CubicO group peptidase (beta-lactamase class C family)
VLTNRASGYARRNGKLANCIHFEMDTPHAAGALYSTVEDLLRWDQALYTDKLVSTESLRALFTPVKGGYGYGWYINQRHHRRVVEHGGGIAGFVTSLSRYPEDKATFIVLSNIEFANPTAISRALEEMYFASASATASAATSE